jgi:ketosteroid isomerase-like protein
VSAANKAVLARILKAYETGDFTPFLDALDEDVVWNSHAGEFRFGGARKGRAGVLEAMAIIATEYQITRYRVTEMVGEGDVVWATNEVSVQDRRSGRVMTFPLINRWQFKDGRIVAGAEFFDTAAVLKQLGRLTE